MGQAARAPGGPAEPGRRIGHYEILAEIGRGGMGVIYRARDLKLGRYVALKSPWPADPDPRQRSRFMREARATSRLSHPHIVPLFEVLEEDGTPWLAMELVEGLSLRARLGPGRPLPLLEVLRYAEELASALQAAHARNILHRDVNPNNVMVTADGRAVLTDFGLAQFVRKSENSSTESRDSAADGRGRVVGTPHYMSPEQALGKPLDPRSDIFALGAVIYEMCTGQRAFPGSGGDVVDAILHREPASASRLNYEVPEELERIVRKALAKDPGERYQDARDLLVDLRALRRRLDHTAYAAAGPVAGGRTRARWVLGGAAAAVAVFAVLATTRRPPAVPSPAPTAAPASTRMRVGVLPHVDLSGRAGDGWPELIQALYVRELTGVQDLGVLDPMSLNGLIETAVGARDPRRGPELYGALRKADLTYVIDGTVAGAKGGLRIQTNVVEPGTGEVRFSVDAVVAREDEFPDAVAGMSRRVLAFLQLKGLAATQDKDLRPWLEHRARNLDAVRAFAQASDYAMRNRPGAARHLQRAIELDPTFVSPRVWLISSLVMRGEFDEAREHHRYLQTIEATASPFEQAMIGWAGAAIARDSAAQARHLEVALTYSPGNNILLVTLAEAHFRTGAFDRALAALSAPLAGGWRYPGLHSLHGVCLVALGRFDEAERDMKAALPGAPADPDVYAILAVLAFRRGDTEAGTGYRKEYVTQNRESGTPPGAVLEGFATHLLLAGLARPAGEAMIEALAAEGGRLEPANFWSQTLYGTWKADEFERSLLGELERDPAWSAGRLLLARIAETRGRREDALGRYEAFRQSDPRSAAGDGARRRAEALRAATARSAKR